MPSGPRGALTQFLFLPPLPSGEEGVHTISLDQIALGDLSDEYQKDDIHLENLTKALRLKLDEITEFEQKTGKKVISNEDYFLLQEIKKKHNNREEEQEEGTWKPQIEPAEANIIQLEEVLKKQISKDLSDQYNPEVSEIDKSSSVSTRVKEDQLHADNYFTMRSNSKNIGKWGEEVAKRHLEEKYVDKEVIWLNQSGSIGVGYDFVIRNNGGDIAYYEVKSKIDELPQFFEISGAQWGWATKLYSEGRGEMYKILLVSNVGKKDVKIQEIKNPVAEWKAGNIYSDPVCIKF